MRSSSSCGRAVATERVSWAATLAASLTLFAPALAHPQENGGAPLLLIDADTRLASVGFRFVSGRTLEEKQIRLRIALEAPGGFFRNALAWLPFISKPTLPAFSPIELQKDQVRLTRLYEREGFPRVNVGYQVRLDSTDNTVGVVFVIDEGPPLLLRDLRFAATGGGPVALAPTVEGPWQKFTTNVAARRGERLSEALRTRLRSETLEWLRDHGYAFAELSLSAAPDSAASAADVVIEIDPGRRARVGEIQIEDNRIITDRTIRKQLPFRSGHPFRSSQLAEGQRQLFGLELVRVALVDVAAGQPRDSTADVRVRVEEGSLRTIEGELGYTSDGGFSSMAAWSHRNFLGAARTMRASLEARTGFLGTAQGPQSRYGASVTLRQPYLGHYRLSGLLTPAIEYRDDIRDRSTRAGIDATVLWERRALRNFSVNYSFSNRWVSRTRGGALIGAGNLVDLLRALDTVDVSGRTGVLTLSSTWGRVDNPINPSAGWVARASAELAGPAPISTINYGRLTATVHGFVRFGAGGLVTRFSAGRLLPFGRSIPAAGSELSGLLRLRDALFTAGGTDDVRGWSAGLLGPKVPDFDVEVRSDSVILTSANRYVPLGGLARWTGSLELQGPMPFVGAPNKVFGFLDGGQVSIPDERFVPGGQLADDGAFFGTGGGVQFGTPAGPLRISLAYKLNPSALDLRNPELVAQALLLGQPITSVPERPGLRWKLHLSIGRAF
jgi:outer membrane protein insertion porin family